MSEQNVLKGILVRSAKRGGSVNICVTCSDAGDVSEVLWRVELLLSESHRFDQAEKDGGAVFFDRVLLTESDRAESCYMCLLGVCKIHGVHTITVTSGDDESVEFHVSELLAV